MSRFGTAGTFTYAPGDVLTSGTELGIDAQDMFDFPFETAIISDVKSYRTKAGDYYEYENWNKKVYTFTFTDLREVTRGSLLAMVNSLPIVSFSSPPDTDWGTFRMPRNSWSDGETSHERYTVSFSMEEI